jgi:hypothetical protein
LKRHKEMMKPNMDRMIPQRCSAAALLKPEYLLIRSGL